MRFARLTGVVVLAAFAVGCAWMKSGRVEPKPVTPINEPLAELAPSQLVDYLNQQAGRLQSVSYDDVRAVASENGRELGSLNDSSLYSSQPRNFRLIGAHSLAGTMIDIGSNDREFWMYAKPVGKDNYFYCSHDAFAKGDVKFPIPFDTDWVMQALGMAEYDPNGKYEVKADNAQAAYVLSQQTKTRTGQPVVKVTTFNVSDGGGKRPVVRQHAVYAAQDLSKPIASAQIVAAKTIPVTGGSVQVPTEVILDWPQQQFRMTMKLGKERVNENFGDRAAQLFNKPTIRGTNPIDLARYQLVVPSSNVRGQAPTDRRTYRLPAMWK